MDQIKQVLAYHELSKHRSEQFAPGPARLDWASQPDPFRRYEGASTVPLFVFSPADLPLYERTLSGQLPPGSATEIAAISRLFQDALGLSAWKSYGATSWALRTNPSSGNLHPTEAYLISGAVRGLCTEPSIHHYAPKEHLLEKRAVLPASLWVELSQGLDLLFIVLTSVHWREAWKYGERALRYCHLDLGHAIASTAIAAAGLGWNTSLLLHAHNSDLRLLLGLTESDEGPEDECAECLLVLSKEQQVYNRHLFPPIKWEEAAKHITYYGAPNIVSPAHVLWPGMKRVQRQCGGGITGGEPALRPRKDQFEREPDPGLREIIQRRRSALAFDGEIVIPGADFCRIMERALPSRGRIPFETLRWRPAVHLLVYVHRIESFAPGLYFMPREDSEIDLLQHLFREEFEWRQVEGCGLTLFQLLTLDVQNLAQALSCDQEIAGKSCFSLSMIARFEQTFHQLGAGAYKALHWECGAIGQRLYLEAEAAGLRATGIGCFFDDAVHHVLGLKDRSYQSLYHFAIGHPVEDLRLISRPPYPEAIVRRRALPKAL